MINQQHRFRVVFSGEIEEGRDAKTVQASLSKKFKLKPALLKRIMAGRPIVVKNNVDAETAVKYKTEIDALGGVSHIEPLPFKSDLDDKGYIERRQEQRRMRADRRKADRPGSIQPDRRVKDRRSASN